MLIPFVEDRPKRCPQLVALLIAVVACSDPGSGAIGRSDSELEGSAAEGSGPQWFAELPPGIRSSLAEPWFGDLDAMIERRTVRVLTVFSDLFYFLDGVEQKGISYEAAVLFEQALNREVSGNRKVQVLILPVTRDRLIPDLVAGHGDIAAANLTITPERRAQVDFSDPFIRDVREIVVTGPRAPRVEELEDLAGQSMPVRLSTSYYQSVLKLSDSLVAAGLEGVDIQAMDEHLEDVDLLEMVNAGLLPWTVSDTHLAEAWGEVFDALELRHDLAVREGGEIAWAFRKESPQLRDAINEFVRQNRESTLTGNMLLKRYFENAEWVQDALGGADLDRFQAVLDPIRKYAAEYDFDWLLVASLAYQESRLEQSARSNRGAIGVMQVLPSTAAELGIQNIDQIDGNVHAGVKYLARLVEDYFDDPELSALDRGLLSIAAYNAGPSRVARLRSRATELGLDPNRWFGQVEVVAGREIGRETVQYVRNVFKYFVSYRMIADRIEEKDAAGG